MKRVQERTTEQQEERGRAAAEIEQSKLEREKLEQDRDHGVSFGLGH